MDGKALEVALALWRMPSMRAALRQRPLPDDVGDLVELAAGTPERIAQAAGRTDASPSQVLEAVRFYVTEILMHEGSDAYRVLGVSPDAPAAKVKAHHRALQHWLHPDRRGDNWESIYATRVNTAWGELRSPQRRAAYDAREMQVRGSVERDSAAHRVLVSDWRAAQVEQNPWRGWAALGAVLIVCVALIVLAERQASAPAPEWTEASETVPGPEVDLPRVDLGALVDRIAARRQALTRSDAVSAPAVAASPPAFNASFEFKATTADRDDASPPPPQLRSALQAPTDVSATPIAASRSAVDARDDLEAALIQSREAQPMATLEPAAVQTKAPPERSAQSAPSLSIPSLARSVPADVDAMERVRLAHRLGEDIRRYLTGASSRTPPIWSSGAAQDAAASLRQRLHGEISKVARVISPTRLGEPQWRIGADNARMTSRVERAGGDTGPGYVHVQLAWRDGMWLVDGIEAENLQ